jgi:hypothetical protein
MPEFRPFDFLFDPTMQAVTSGGVIVQTSALVLDLIAFTPVPVYVPENEGRGMVDAGEGLEWECVGTYGRIYCTGLLPGTTAKVERIGIHLPEDVRIEFQDWCNAYAEAHPNTPLIPRTEVAHKRNSYTTTKTCLFPYKQLQEYNDDRIRTNTWSSRGRATQQAARFDGR